MSEKQVTHSHTLFKCKSIITVNLLGEDIVFNAPLHYSHIFLHFISIFHSVFFCTDRGTGHTEDEKEAGSSKALQGKKWHTIQWLTDWLIDLCIYVVVWSTFSHAKADSSFLSHRRDKEITSNSRAHEWHGQDDLRRQHRDPNCKWAHRLLQVRQSGWCCKADSHCMHPAAIRAEMRRLPIIKWRVSVEYSKVCLCMFHFPVLSRINSPSSGISSPFGLGQEKCSLVSPQTSISVSDFHIHCPHWCLLQMCVGLMRRHFVQMHAKFFYVF